MSNSLKENIPYGHLSLCRLLVVAVCHCPGQTEIRNLCHGKAIRANHWGAQHDIAGCQVPVHNPCAKHHQGAVSLTIVVLSIVVLTFVLLSTVVLLTIVVLTIVDLTIVDLTIVVLTIVALPIVLPTVTLTVVLHYAHDCRRYGADHVESSRQLTAHSQVGHALGDLMAVPQTLRKPHIFAVRFQTGLEITARHVL